MSQRPQRQSSQSNWSQSSSSSQSQSGRVQSRRDLLPQQQALLDPVASYALNLLRDPLASVQPMYDLAESRINAGYSAVPSTLAERFLAHGGVGSGKFGRAARMAELERMGQIGGLRQDMARAALEQQGRGASLAQNLLSMVFGQTTDSSMSSSGQSTQSGSSSGMQTVYGNMPYGAVSGALGGLGDMLALMVLQDMLKGGKIG